MRGEHAGVTALGVAILCTGCAGSQAEGILAARGDHAAIEPVVRLSSAGLYRDIRNRVLASDAFEYEPRFPFWSDGAHMRRFVQLPAGARIDTSDMDHWSFPQGTRFWKTFDVGGVIAETDLIERLGPGPSDFRFAAYAWNADGNDAELAPIGLRDVRGTGRDVPAVGACFSCHGKLEERVIGFSALQLSHDGPGLNLRALSERGLLTTAVPDEGFAVPGDATAVAALGYLHANCGHCHYEKTSRPMHLRLSVKDGSIEQTAAYRTGVRMESGFKVEGVTTRIVPGNPEASAIHFRMSVRRAGQQMPNYGTHVVDRDGLVAVDAWIAALGSP